MLFHKPNNYENCLWPCVKKLQFDVWYSYCTIYMFQLKDLTINILPPEFNLIAPLVQFFLQQLASKTTAISALIFLASACD